jgi:tetratricopeptide (TPR) repeat protein
MLTLFLAASGLASGQPTTQPRPGPPKKTLEQLVTESKREAILAPEVVTVAGKPPTSDEMASLKKAVELLEAAAKAASSGDFAKAAADAEEARRIREEILGFGNHWTLSASAAANTWSGVAKLAEGLRADFAKTEKDQPKAREYYESGKYAKAVELARAIVDTRAPLAGKDSPSLVEPLRTMGAALTELRVMQDADAALNRALTISSEALGKSHPTTALVLDRLGWLQLCQGKSSKAAETLERSLGILKRAVGETAETAEVMDNFGTAATMNGAPERGERLKVRSLVIRQVVVGLESKDVGVSLSNLAWLYNRSGRPEEVIPLRQRALAIFRARLGMEHPYTQVEMLNLAQAYVTNQKYAETAALLEGPVAQDRKHKGPVTLEMAGRSTRLGMVYLRAGRWSDGRKLLRRTMRLIRGMYKTGDARVAQEALRQLLTVYQGERMLKESAAGFELLRGWESSESREPAVVVRRDVDLASLYVDLGRVEEAKMLLEEVTESVRASPGANARDLMSTLSVLALANERTGNLDESERLWDEVLLLTERTVRGRTPPHAFALRGLGRVYARQKRFDQAVFTLEDARDILDNSPGADKADLIRMNWDHVECLAAMGKKADAVKLLDEALALARSQYNKTKQAYAQAMLAKTLVRLVAALDDPPDGHRREELKVEAIDALRHLDRCGALDAEDERALKELSGRAKTDQSVVDWARAIFKRQSPTTSRTKPKTRQRSGAD